MSMRVILNGEEVTAAQGAALADLLRERGYAGDFPYAAAVDGEVVPAAQHASRILAEGARVEVVALRQGG